MSITNEQLVEHISGMSVLEVANLVKELEEKFGVSAAPVAVAGGAAAGGLYPGYRLQTRPAPTGIRDHSLEHLVAQRPRHAGG